MAEECEKIVEIKKISKNKDLTSAVTVISKEKERNTEEINNLKEIIQKLMTTTIRQPTTPALEEKTIAALNRFATARIDGKWPSDNRESRKIVRFRSESPSYRSRSQTPNYRVRNNSPYSIQENTNQNSNWGNQKLYESRRCYVCDKKGHLARQCWKAEQNQNPRRNHNTRQTGQQNFNRMNSQFQRSRNGSFRNETGKNRNN
jgi:hypothetical protein